MATIARWFRRGEDEGRGPRGRLGACPRGRAWMRAVGGTSPHCGRKHPAGRLFGAGVPSPRAPGFSYPRVGPWRSRDTLPVREAFARCREKAEPGDGGLGLG